jgi:hypothetical protein
MTIDFRKINLYFLNVFKIRHIYPLHDTNRQLVVSKYMNIHKYVNFTFYFSIRIYCFTSDEHTFSINPHDNRRDINHTKQRSL